MSAVDFHSVKAGLLGSAGCLSKLVNYYLDFIYRQLPGGFPQFSGGKGGGTHSLN